LEAFLIDSPTLPNKTHILVVEDDESLSQWIVNYLVKHEYEVSIANRGDSALLLIKEDNPDLVLLDINLPVKDGFDICREARHFFNKPILMMTASDDEIDEVLGLEIGADDYITKPIRPRALLARIKLLLKKRAESLVLGEHDPVLSYGCFALDKTSRTVSLNGRSIKISSNEYELLLLLCTNAGVTMSRKRLISELRGINYDGVDRTIDTMISRLRKKLNDDMRNPMRIKTVWGKGYIFAPDAW
jgi:DNA-binding response OmpR family regulator